MLRGGHTRFFLDFSSSVNQHQLGKLILKFLFIESAVASEFSVNRGDGLGGSLGAPFVQWLSAGMDYEFRDFLRLLFDDLLQGGLGGGLLGGLWGWVDKGLIGGLKGWIERAC